MLVLSRKTGQSIVIDGNITVQVVYIDRGRVRLGITAPADVSVERPERLAAREAELKRGEDCP